MLGTRSLLAATGVALVATPALAAKTGADTWQGKISKTRGVSIVRQANDRNVTASIFYQCEIDGVAYSYTAILTGKPKDGKIDFKGEAYGGGGGSATIKATLGNPKARGKVKVDNTAVAPGCKFSARFKAKYKFVAGG